MIYSNVPNPPSKFTATMWGKTITIELDHSDIDLNELMDIFKGLAIASGFEMISWNNVIKDTASEIYDEEHEIVKDALDTSDDDDNDFFGSWGSVEEESVNERMDIIGQNGNEGTHYDEDANVWGDNDEEDCGCINYELDTPTDEYKGIYSSRPTYDWDNETNDILTNINDSITIIKDRMEDIDMRMDNIDEQLGILNADVANIEYSIENPIRQSLLNAKEVYDKSVIETERFNKVRKDIVDMKTGEVNYDKDGGFAVKMNKNKITKGKIKDLKK